MTQKSARLVRLVTPDHLCPWGIKAYDILRRRGFSISDEHLKSSDENRDFKKEHDVDETPQIWIEQDHIGGYDALRAHLGMPAEGTEGRAYQPVIVLFCVAALLSVAVSIAFGSTSWIGLIERFIAFLMVLLGVQKLQDLSQFTTGFVQYDLIAQRDVRYGYIYPFIETGAGLLMLGSWGTWAVAPVVLFTSVAGLISIVKAVLVEKRDLECACTGGGDGVPLGFLSMTENVLMAAMAVWMMIKAAF